MDKMQNYSVTDGLLFIGYKESMYARCRIFVID